MISKELLSEVLKFENISNIGLNGCNEIVFRDSTYQDCKPRIIVNVHELAHKCKEWARDKGFDIGSIINEAWIVKKDIMMDEFYADTEPEAIFKACEYVLKETTK